jgi:hypothetical protein
VNIQRKYAYRYLLYLAMLDIRPIQWLGRRRLRSWNPLYWRGETRRVQLAGAIADWLHNLALFSSHDFKDFSEEWFWRDFDSIQKRYPEVRMERYREMFEQRASTVTANDDAPSATADSSA